MKRKKWIDLARGLCMLAILYDHTEVYYTGKNIIPYHLYVSNALIAFYFISGYLFYKNHSFRYSYKIRSILRTIIIPYFIFTCLIASPKAWIHGNTIDPISMFNNILLGKASWFVAALILAELIFSTLLFICKRKIWILFALSIGCFILSIILSNHHVNYPWQVNNALQAVLILCLGYLYHIFEETKHHVSNQLIFIVSTILLILIKLYETYDGIDLYISPIVIDNYVIFLLDIIIFVIWLIHLCKYLEEKMIINSTLFQMISWTGSHSLVYYFLCGGVPLMVSLAMKKMNYAYEGNYLFVIIAFISVYLITSAIVWLIYRYLPQITGRY